ncbi:DUF3883 domain-containing protein [Luteimonas qiangzhengi]|uniref:DUF3883 domain-containing protein n=1 Tax=Luteimonas sp. MJ146 TaxID=3129240 RepID=UPI0031BB8CA3
MADYLRMLTLELNGQRYSKTAQANALMRLLSGRSRQSVEFKHANISAVMIELGYPYIDGYKPRANYQAMLFEAVEQQLAQNPDIQAAVEAAVVRPAATVEVEDHMSVWVPKPKVARLQQKSPDYKPNFSPARRDYLAQEARNRSLGQAGEIFTAEIEARRLHDLGKKNLADRVEHVARTQGDGLGYDVLSFETDGRERLIEVKSTTFGQLTPFYVTRNEVARSEMDSEAYHVYRVFDFRNRPRVFAVPGAISASCDLQVVSYLARLIT